MPFDFKLTAEQQRVKDTPNSDACAAMVGLLTLGLNPMEAPSLRFEEPAPAPA